MIQDKNKIHSQSNRSTSSVHVNSSTSVPGGERPECKHLMNYAVKADGAVDCWKVGEEPYECFPSWASLTKGKSSFWLLENGVVAFLNAFFVRQRYILCRTPVEQQRIFFIKRYNGLGNSLEGTLSYLMMGALSNRLVVLDGWLGAFGEVFDSPLSEFTMERLQQLKLMENWNPGACINEVSHDPRYGCFGPDAFDQYQWCGRIDDRFPKRLNQVAGCCDNNLPLLMMNKHYSFSLRHAFGERELSTPLLRVLFRPSYRNVVTKVKPGPPGTIAVHLRHFGNYDPQDLIQAVGGCLKSRIVHEKPSQVRVFAMKKALTDEFVKFINSPLVVDGEPPGGEFHDVPAWINALKDIWTMSTADHLVLSPWSSFGQIAAAYGGITPWESDGDYGGIAETCYQAVSPEPCTMRTWAPDIGVCPAGVKTEKLPPRFNRTCNRKFTAIKHVPPEPLLERAWEDLTSSVSFLAHAPQTMISDVVSFAQRTEQSYSSWLENRYVSRAAESTFQTIAAKYSSMTYPSYCPQQFSNLYPEWRQELEKKAQERAVNGKLIFTMADKKYAKRLRCWQQSVIAMTGLDNTLILATDAATIDTCRKEGLHCVDVDPTLLPPMKNFGDIGFVKFYGMSIIADLKITFIFSEMDVLILKNPWPYHENDDAEQFSAKMNDGDTRCYPKAYTVHQPKRDNSPTKKAVLQVTAHFNHPRLNIGYLYSKGSSETMVFFNQLAAFFAGKCADDMLGWVPPKQFYVDDGHADQNIFDAFLRNSDHTNPRYHDVPWDKLPKLNWKLLDFNIFGLYGKNVPAESVTWHYAGQTDLQESCWEDVCVAMDKINGKLATLEDVTHPPCVKLWWGSECVPRKPGAVPTLQGLLADRCIPKKLDCHPVMLQANRTGLLSVNHNGRGPSDAVDSLPPLPKLPPYTFDGV
eukprot:TRINITY_DN16393_c1_g1_i1.p1 TRINITY_DN16393_c1_g1~~TRINITY_DN16393_c1_g1_i1.p1  ORF type:complete len:918 (-),score=133.67 TRINITY_DN16393_c1_g1_i1:295-3048(-)